MDWINGISILLGAVGGISGISALIYYKPRSKIEQLSVSNKQLDVANEAMETLVRVQKQLKANIDEIGILRESDSELWLIVGWLSEVVDKQISRKEFAESNICTVAECELRVPPLGTYKTGNSDADMKMIMEKIKKLQDNKKKQADG